MRLNRDVLRAAYDYLDSTEPFCHWNLPDSNEVVFKVGRQNGHRGKYALYDDGGHEIQIMETAVKDTLELMTVMAHEMVHMFQCESGMSKRSNIGHGPAFRKLARRICKVHAFDYKNFCL